MTRKNKILLCMVNILHYEGADRMATVTQILALYKHEEQKSISAFFSCVEL